MNKKMEGSILEKLKCDFCNDLLSCSPVRINNEGKNMCGRCDPPESTADKFVRNLVFEELATLAQFPCINHTNGCKIVVKLDNSKYHEENCPYRVRNEPNQTPELKCPLSKTSNCTWSGRKQDLELHCKNNHVNQIFEQPYCPKPYLNKNSEKHVIIKVFNYLFLLQVKCVLQVSKIWYNVQFLGPSNLSHLFEYNLQFKKDKNCIAEKNNIEPYNTKDIKSVGSCHKITNLINLIGPYEDINIELKIYMKQEICIQCKNIIKEAPFIPSNEEGKYICITCNEIISLMNIDGFNNTETITNVISSKKTTENPSTSSNKEAPSDNKNLSQNNRVAIKNFLQDVRSAFSKSPTLLKEFQCNNIQYGCTFSSLDEKLIDRHENWLCTWGPACLRCFNEFHPDGRINHFASHHTDVTRYGTQSNQISKIICKNTLTFTNSQITMKECHGRTFIAIFEFTEDSNYLYVTTEENNENQLFTFRFRISDSLNDFVLHGDLSRIKNDNEQMYWLTEFPKFDDINNTFNFIMTIKKW